MPGSHGGQKRALDPLGLELQTVINCPVGAGKFTRALCRSSQF